MKALKLFLPIICIAILCVYGFQTKQKGGSIIGRIIPPEGGIQVLAISSSDTFKTAINNGLIQITGIKPGNYNLYIQAKPPFKNAQKNNVIVTDVTTDIGEIVLMK